jgi:hypothetical protein
MFEADALSGGSTPGYLLAVPPGLLRFNRMFSRFSMWLSMIFPGRSQRKRKRNGGLPKKAAVSVGLPAKRGWSALVPEPEIIGAVQVGIDKAGGNRQRVGPGGGGHIEEAAPGEVV